MSLRAMAWMTIRSSSGSGCNGKLAASLFGCLSLMLPPGVSHSVTPWFELKSRAPGKTRMQEQVLGLLGVNGSMSARSTAAGDGLVTRPPCLPDLERAGQIIAPVSVRDAHHAATHRALVDCAAGQCRHPDHDRHASASSYDWWQRQGRQGIRANEAIDRHRSLRTGGAQS